MNHQGHSMKGHLLHMLIAGAAVLGVLLLAGFDLGKAAPYAILLACPVGMIGMMWMMTRGNGMMTRGNGKHQQNDQQPSRHRASSLTDQPEPHRHH